MSPNSVFAKDYYYSQTNSSNLEVYYKWLELHSVSLLGVVKRQNDFVCGEFLRPAWYSIPQPPSFGG